MFGVMQAVTINWKLILPGLKAIIIHTCLLVGNQCE